MNSTVRDTGNALVTTLVSALSNTNTTDYNTVQFYSDSITSLTTFLSTAPDTLLNTKVGAVADTTTNATTTNATTTTENNVVEADDTSMPDLPLTFENFCKAPKSLLVGMGDLHGKPFTEYQANTMRPSYSEVQTFANAIAGEALQLNYYRVPFFVLEGLDRASIMRVAGLFGLKERSFGSSAKGRLTATKRAQVWERIYEKARSAGAPC